MGHRLICSCKILPGGLNKSSCLSSLKILTANNHSICNKHETNTGVSFLCYGSVIFTLRTSSQETRFERILAKQETENTTVVNGT